MDCQVSESSQLTAGSPHGPPSERRKEGRLRHRWPVWCSPDGERDIHQGWMVDISSRGVSFLISVGTYPKVGHPIWLHSAYPFAEEKASGMASFTAFGRVLRCDPVSQIRRRIAVQFDMPLEPIPAEVPGQVFRHLGTNL